MKVITLVPVKNESWILRSSLNNFSSFSDHIIIADQNSSDSSLEIYREFSKVQVIQNNEEGHSNKVRWILLEEARKIPGNNLILCIDADEMISPQAVEYIKSEIKDESAVAFQFNWIQLWKSTDKYRVDGVWKENKKVIAFLDDRKVDYEKTFVINDHTSRTPAIDKIVDVSSYPLLHFQYVAWDQTQMKQAWYRCSELIAGKDPKKINLKYSITLETSKTKLLATPTQWLADIDISNIQNPTSSWHFDEIVQWFNQKGIEFFEPLQIWHIKELKDIFTKQTNKEPVSRIYPDYLITLNSIKNKIKNVFFRK